MVSVIYFVLFISFLFNCHAWNSIGTGVNYRQGDQSMGNNILITYAGWNVNQIQAQAWTDRLLAKSPLANDLFGHVYAVRGPLDSGYAAKEIQNSKLIEHMYTTLASKMATRRLPDRIVVIAHSSGSFVADEFFSQLYTKIAWYPSNNIYAGFRQRLQFYNLDGATTPSRRDSTYLNTLFSKIRFVWASSTSVTGLRSMNAGTMIAAPSYFPFSSTLSCSSLEIRASKAVCYNSRCLHDALIIQSPWNAYDFETSKDYTLFTVNGREVQFDYLL